jgi:hypothetical protein
MKLSFGIAGDVPIVPILSLFQNDEVHVPIVPILSLFFERT